MDSHLQVWHCFCWTVHTAHLDCAVMDTGSVWHWGTGCKLIDDRDMKTSGLEAARPRHLLDSVGMSGRRVVNISSGHHTTYAIAERATLLDENVYLHKEVRKLASNLMDSESSSLDLNKQRDQASV